MRRLRNLMGLGRGWFAFLLAFTLALKLVVPTGYMPVIEHGRISLQLCSGMTPVSAEPMAMPGMHHGEPDRSEHGKLEQPCGCCQSNANRSPHDARRSLNVVA